MTVRNLKFELISKIYGREHNFFEPL